MPSAPSHSVGKRLPARRRQAPARTRRYNAGLPPEIWREILFIATNTLPSPLSIHDVDSLPSLSDTFQLSNEEYGRLYRQSMRIKLAISLVNRYWNTVSKELLYHTIIFHRPSQITTLWRTLQQDARMCTSPVARRSWWIRSLQLKCQLNQEHAQEWLNICSIIAFCPRLLTLKGQAYPFKSIRTREKSPWNMVTTALRARKSETHNRSALVCLNWEDTLKLRLGQFLYKNPWALLSVSSVTTLVLRCLNMNWAGLATFHSITLPALQTLKVINYPNWTEFRYWKLPLLRRLCSRCTDWSLDRESRRLFYTVHGLSIIELETCADELRWFNQSGGILFQSLCPNVTRLHISVLAILDALGRVWSLKHSSIRVLGLWGMEDLGESQRVPILHLVMGARANLPHLETIQDLSRGSQDLREEAVDSMSGPATRHASFCNSLLQCTVAAGVKNFLDWSGEPILLKEIIFETSYRCGCEHCRISRVMSMLKPL